MWSRFQDVAPSPNSQYPAGTIADLKKIGDRIGGTVKRNFDQGVLDIQGSPGSFPAAPKGFTNGCATRMSYVLNHCGVPVPHLHGATVTGADHKNYIFRVKDMQHFIPREFGKPDLHKGPEATQLDFAGKRGIIIFSVHWKDATGHVTLWNGQDAVDEAYFTPGSRHGAPLLGVSLWVCP